MESALRRIIPPGTRLIETFGWYPGLRYADLHLARLQGSADALGFPFNADHARALMHQGSESRLRCRLTLDVEGEMQITTTALSADPPYWRIQIAPIRLRSDDPWLGVKSTQRALYDQMRAALPSGVDEWLFLNERAELAEGTITNLFLKMQDGQMLTPARACGVLPGVLRASLLSSGWREAHLHLSDLQHASRVWVGNSLRGLIPAEVIFPGSVPHP